MKNRLLFLTFLIVSLALASVASVFVFGQVRADNKETKEVPVAVSSEADPPSVARPETNLQMPILMYHHIRDYDNASDQIGINLSVSPTKLAQQLDEIAAAGYNTTTFEEISSGIAPTKPIILTFDDGYENFYANAYPLIKARGMKAVVFVIVNFHSNDYMSTDQIKEISMSGIEIGSHTLTHPDLSTATETKRSTEIVESKSVLESLLGKPVLSFCYPSGKHNDATMSAVENAGYQYAVTTTAGVAHFVSPYDLNRFRVNHDTSITGYLK